MNQKFGDIFAKFLFVFFVWTVIAFFFGIGHQEYSMFSFIRKLFKSIYVKPKEIMSFLEEEDYEWDDDLKQWQEELKEIDTNLERDDGES